MENQTKSMAKSTLTGEIVFLLMALPLGIVFFSLTLTCFLLGVGTLIIWIGLPILFATLYMVHGMATMERNMVRNLLHMPHADLPYGRPRAKGFWRNFGNLLRDPYTWMSLLYMLFIKLPLGIISFTLVITFISLSFCLTCLPLIYLVNVFINAILVHNGVSDVQSILIPSFVGIHGSFDPMMFARSFTGIPLGLVLWFATRSLIKGLAGFCGVLANAMLGPGATGTLLEPHTQNYVSPIQQQVYAPAYGLAPAMQHKAYND